MQAYDTRTALSDVQELVITPSMSEADAARSMQLLTMFNQCMLGVVRFSGQTPWERHPDGDELLHVLEGTVDVTVLTDGAPVHTTVGVGSVFIVPRGLWHRQLAHSAAALLFATPAETTEHSWATDPRRRK